MAQQQAYPIQLAVDYPDRSLNRLSSAFRIFLAIPILIILVLVEGSIGGRFYWVAAGGTLVFPTLLMILFRQKYPRWWFDFNVELLKFSSRVTAYVVLLRDEYPSTDEEQAVPEAQVHEARVLRLGGAEPGAVEELEVGAVPERDRAPDLGRELDPGLHERRGEEASDGLLREEDGRAGLTALEREPLGRVARGAPLLDERAERAEDPFFKRDPRRAHFL
jgi:hypothetical protein